MATRRQFLVYGGVAGAVVVAGAAGFVLLPEDEKPSGLPKVRFGKEKCARCGMLIGDRRFAAAWRNSDGDEKHFDDIGCMVLEGGEQPPGDGTLYWACSYSDESWLDAASATYVISPGIRSPMSYGVAATAGSGEAETLAGVVKGKVAAWQELPTIMKERA
ncbi:MAG: twin-arginine translocation signal domain-containing protein [Dehalococcoidia bacterium]|nr:twin-arginine translocation signal domain-containing protein [Dehalococcoidia bacterium]